MAAGQQAMLARKWAAMQCSALTEPRARAGAKRISVAGLESWSIQRPHTTATNGLSRGDRRAAKWRTIGSFDCRLHVTRGAYDASPDVSQLLDRSLGQRPTEQPDKVLGQSATGRSCDAPDAPGA